MTSVTLTLFQSCRIAASHSFRRHTIACPSFATVVFESVPALFFIIPRARNLINGGRWPSIPQTKCHLIGNWWLYTRKNVRLNDWHNLLLIRIDPISNNVRLLDHSSLRSLSISLSPLFGQLDLLPPACLLLATCCLMLLLVFTYKSSSSKLHQMTFVHFASVKCRGAPKYPPIRAPSIKCRLLELTECHGCIKLGKPVSINTFS